MTSRVCLNDFPFNVFLRILSKFNFSTETFSFWWMALGPTPYTNFKSGSHLASSRPTSQSLVLVISGSLISVKSIPPLTSMFLIQAYIISHLDCCPSFLTGLTVLILSSSLTSLSSILCESDLSDHLSLAHVVCTPIHMAPTWNPSLLSNHTWS